MKLKALHLLLLLVGLNVLLPQQASAQYNNSWIDFSKTYFKIKVANDGLYRIPYTTLQSQAVNGLTVNTIPGSSFNMYHNGQVVPIYVTTQGILGNSDFIEFYGQHNDGVLETALYDSAGTVFSDWQTNEYYSNFNDTSAYYLTWNTAASNILITSVANDLTNLPAKETYCMTKLVQAYNNTYNQGRPYYLANEPLYESVFDAGEGFTDYPNTGTKIYSLPTPGFYSNAGVPATLRASLVSTTNTSHAISVNFNAQPQLYNSSFFGFQNNKWSWAIPSTGLQTSNNFVVSENGGGSASCSLGFVELTYPNTFNFNGASQTKFSISGSFGDKYIEVSNYNANSTAPILYDLTNNLRIVGNAGTAPYKFHLPTVPASNTRDLLLISQGSNDVFTVNTISRLNLPNYNNPNNQGDFIIITDKSFLNDGAGNNWVTAYANYRKTAAGGNHTVSVGYMDELYELFGYGIAKSPIAIRNFIRYANATWTVKPKYVLLIGKGREYAFTRTDAGAYAQCLVPTYGYPGSDHLLAAPEGSITPLVPIGRISANNGDDVRKYLTKVKDFESEQEKVGDPYQTIANKLWTKNVIHLGGGNDAVEQYVFKNNLDYYKTIISSTLYGANVNSFFKTSTAPIQQALSDYLTALINGGVSLMTFFGHSSPNSFDFSVDDPTAYQNYKRYPLIISNGCFAGNVFNPGQGISEKFVLTENKGAIGFLATPALSSSDALNIFSAALYQNLDSSLYDHSTGEAIKKTVRDVEVNNNNPFNRMAAEGLALNGDPSEKINTHPYPDYDLEAQNVSFTPPVVTVQSDTFFVNVIVANLGKAINDSIVLQINRTFPDGSTVAYSKKFKATYYLDTISIPVLTGGSRSFGLNNLQITIDPTNHIPIELSKTNNTLGVPLNILSQDVFPIYPYEFSIMPNKDITLNASTANAFAPTRHYIMQIDTTELYNSPLKQQTTITQSGGVLKWKPIVNYQDSVVYYWRVGLDTLGQGNPANILAWHGWSFMYLTGDTGWNQSHYFQFKKDQYANEYLDSTDRYFKFVGNTRQVTTTNGTWTYYGGSLPDDQISYFLDGQLEERWNCGGSGGFPAGLTMSVFDPISGQPWVSSYGNISYDNTCTPGAQIDATYKSIHCKPRDVNAYDFPTQGNCWQQRIIDFINALPNGYYILAYSVNDPQYNYWSPQLINAFHALGATKIDTLVSRGSGAPWAFFARKGTSAYTPVEQAGVFKTDVVHLSATFTANWYQGTTTSTIIGPAVKWRALHWRYFAREANSNDQQSLKVIGIKADGSETTLLPHVTALDTSLLGINAKVYPNLKLVQNTRDDTTRTPTQLKYWRVTYDKVPEAALNAFTHFQWHGDTLNYGDQLSLSVAVENVTNIPMDSLLVKYTIQNATRGTVSEYVRYDSLRAFKTMNLNYKFNTGCANCLTPINSLIVEVNPNNDQREQWHFNNYGTLQFNLQGDKINPLLDVTFDQQHILNGDIVSTKPDIMIRLKDENKYLALDDTSLINVFVKYPNGNITRINYRDPDVTFTPAIASQLNKNNTAEIHLKRNFPDNGTYELQVQAQDRSRNASGTYGGTGNGIDYHIQYDVINTSMITNVLNYPNPFTTKTRFVFTLTGADIPSFFKIQIMTITGKVVREVMKEELGNLHIGRNVTEFAWDGTDQYGSPLGNGLYLYRVVASINGKNIDHMDSGADKYFKSGFGKMYLAR